MWCLHIFGFVPELSVGFVGVGGGPGALLAVDCGSVEFPDVASVLKAFVVLSVFFDFSPDACLVLNFFSNFLRNTSLPMLVFKIAARS